MDAIFTPTVTASIGGAMVGTQVGRMMEYGFYGQLKCIWVGAFIGMLLIISQKQMMMRRHMNDTVLYGGQRANCHTLI
jgi:hypothetical protein